MDGDESLSSADHEQPQQHVPVLGKAGDNNQPSQCFVVAADFSRRSEENKSESLQEAFLKFRRNRQVSPWFL